MPPKAATDDPLSPAAPQVAAAAPAAVVADTSPAQTTETSSQAKAEADPLSTDASLQINAPPPAQVDASLSPAAPLTDASLSTAASLSPDASLPAASLSTDASLPAASLPAASLQTNAPPPAQVDASLSTDAPLTDAQPVPHVVAEAVQAATDAQAVAPPGTPDATKAVPVDANYSAFLGAVVHALAELYGIKDDAKVVITSDMVSAANFTATLEVNNEKLTITLTPVDGSAGPAALEAIKLRLAEALKPAAVVSAVEAAVDASAVPVQKPAVESDAAVETEAAAAVQATTPAVEAAATGNLGEAAKSGGYRRRKRNLRTIKKQQQRNRRTMNKH